MEWEDVSEIPVAMEITVKGTNHKIVLLEQSVHLPEYSEMIDIQCQAIKLFMEQERRYLDNRRRQRVRPTP